MRSMAGYFPLLEWERRYDRSMLAGLPEVGFFASVLPLVAFALFGTTRPTNPSRIDAPITATNFG